MTFKTLEDIKNRGFQGFVTTQSLQEQENYEIIPDEDGIYLILRISDAQPEFLSVNPSRLHSRHKNRPEKHSYDVERLQRKWKLVEGSIVVYIGKAGGGKHDTSLRERLRNYMRAGKTTPGSSSHSGGRAIWQFADSADLLVCWKPTTGQDAIEVEHQLIAEFKAIYGSFPLANWKS